MTDLIKELRAEVARQAAVIVELEHQRATATAEIDRLDAIRRQQEKVVSDLMPFVLEDYFPECATPGFKLAVEAARALSLP